MAVDLRGTWLCSRAAAEVMASRGQGAIVNMSWDHVLSGMGNPTAAIYAAAKGGIMALSRCLAREFAPACVSTSWPRLDQDEVGRDGRRGREPGGRASTPLARWGRPEDVAAAVLFLASPESAFITGETILVGGGTIMAKPSPRRSRRCIMAQETKQQEKLPVLADDVIEKRLKTSCRAGGTRAGGSAASTTWLPPPGPGQHDRLPGRSRLASPRPGGHLGQGLGQAPQSRLERRHRAGLRAGRKIEQAILWKPRSGSLLKGRRTSGCAAEARTSLLEVMPGKTVFVTGKLAAPALRTTLEAMAPPFAYDVAVLGISVAALMTTSWIARHLAAGADVERILIPGLCEGDVGVLEDRLGVKVEKGPADLRDLPEYFGGAALRQEYGAFDIRIFAEINNVPYLTRQAILDQARHFPRPAAPS